MNFLRDFSTNRRMDRIAIATAEAWPDAFHSTAKFKSPADTSKSARVFSSPGTNGSSLTLTRLAGTASNSASRREISPTILWFNSRFTLSKYHNLTARSSRPI
jgi:hypothetical protein